MNVNSFETTLTQSFEGLKIFFEELFEVGVRSALTFAREVGAATEALRSPIKFTELQVPLFKVLIFILITNLFLIGWYWRNYGHVITDKFVRPSEY